MSIRRSDHALTLTPQRFINDHAATGSGVCDSTHGGVAGFWGACTCCDGFRDLPSFSNEIEGKFQCPIDFGLFGSTEGTHVMG